MAPLFGIKSLKQYWPIGVISTRYAGEIEGYEWMAIPNMVPFLPEIADALDDDPIKVAEWWSEESNLQMIGAGDTPNEALKDLLVKKLPEVERVLEQEPESTVDPVQIAHKAADDSLSLLTASVEDQVQNTYKMTPLLLEEIYNEWEDEPWGTEPLVAAMSNRMGNLLIQIAIATSSDPQECLKQYARMGLEARNEGGAHE